MITMFSFLLSTVTAALFSAAGSTATATATASSAPQSTPVVRPCAELLSLAVPGVTITAATDVPAGPFTPSGGRPITVAAFCRVVAVAAPTTDSSIQIEVWIPAGAAWNGKLLGTANGGFGGSIGYAAMSAGLARGYATVGTDTGHAGDQLDFAKGHPEKVTDWAYRSVHVMTEFAKLVVRQSRGRFPDFSYFDGCSTGGQQGLSEAQRYPLDYDGIVAGDPGHNRVRLILGFLWGWASLHRVDGTLLLPTSKLPMITQAAVASCDAADGITDGVIGEPLSCRFDPRKLLCTGDDGPTCLTAPQAAAVQRVYDGAKNPRTGETIFAGWARGSEQGWGTYLMNPPEPSRIGFFRNIAYFDPAWDWRTFDWDKDVAFVDRHSATLSATSRDLTAFKANGGKLIMYTGLADPVVPPADTIAYYLDVTKTMGGQASTQAFFRFFPVPGMGHCSGGAGPSSFDALAALEAWRERGVAPSALDASHRSNVGDATRPICAYPTVARYRGTGDLKAASSFTCAAPGVSRPSRGSAASPADGDSASAKTPPASSPTARPVGSR